MKTKKIILLLTFLLMLLGIITTTSNPIKTEAAGASGTSGNIHWSLNGSTGQLTLSGTGMIGSTIGGTIDKNQLLKANTKSVVTAGANIGIMSIPSSNPTGLFQGYTNLESFDGSGFTNAAGSLKKFFYQDSNLKTITLPNLNTTNVTDMSDMFNNTASLSSVDLSKFDTSNVTDMSNMFSSTGAKTINLNFNTSNVIRMQNMFGFARNVTSLNVANWDISKVTDLTNVFSSTQSLKTIDVSKWNTSNVTSFAGLFWNCSAQKIDVSNWKTSNVTSLYHTFDGVIGLTSPLDLSKWDTSNVTDMTNTFANNPNGFAGDLMLDNWNTSNVTTMYGMFSGSKLSTRGINVLNWNTSSVTIMYGMFAGTNITSFDGSKLNTSKVQNMSSMFMDANKLTSVNIPNWDTSSVTDMSELFEGASSLSSINIGSWKTKNVQDMNRMFENTSALTTIDLSSWTTDSVTNFTGMFKNSGVTNLNITGFNTASAIAATTDQKKPLTDFLNTPNIISLSVGSKTLLDSTVGLPEHKWKLSTGTPTFATTSDLMTHLATANPGTYLIVVDPAQIVSTSNVKFNSSNDFMQTPVSIIAPTSPNITIKGNNQAFSLAIKMSPFSDSISKYISNATITSAKNSFSLGTTGASQTLASLTAAQSAALTNGTYTWQFPSDCTLKFTSTVPPTSYSSTITYTLQSTPN